MKIGILINNEQISLSDTTNLAQQAEACGLDSVWIPEYWRSYSVPLAAIATATSRIQLHAGVSMGFSRSPFLNARVAADLDELSGGRITLGLGTGTLNTTQDDAWGPGWSQPEPASLRGVIESFRYAIRTWYDKPGAALDFESEHCRLHVSELLSKRKPIRREIPVFLGVRQPKALALAGELADGLLTLPMTPARTIRDTILPNIAKGARTAGRDTSSITIAAIQVAAALPDREQARSLARQQLVWAILEAGNRPVLIAEGFQDEVNQICEMSDRCGLSELERVVTDEMIDRFTISGSPDEVRKRLSEMDGSADSVVLMPAQWASSPQDIMQGHRNLIEAFA